MSDPLNTLPDPPYFAVIFSALQRSSIDADQYAAVAARMQELATHQPGFLGVTSVRGENGLGVTISYWSDAESIALWREHAEHRMAQEQGRGLFYKAYRLEVCRVDRVSRHPAAASAPTTSNESE